MELFSETGVIYKVIKDNHERAKQWKLILPIQNSGQNINFHIACKIFLVLNLKNYFTEGVFQTNWAHYRKT